MTKSVTFFIKTFTFENKINDHQVIKHNSLYKNKKPRVHCIKNII